jgi:hypothetical protein
MAITRKQIATRIAQLEEAAAQQGGGGADGALSRRWLATMTLDELVELERVIVENDAEGQAAFQRRLDEWATNQNTGRTL